MKLVFADGSQIDVRAIRGGQQYIQGAYRDVLTIEVDPAEYAISVLKELFRDAEKTAWLATVQDDDPDVQHVIGTDYTIYLSASNEMREVMPEPGTLAQPIFEEINVVKIAQVTYMEKVIAEGGLADVQELHDQIEDLDAALGMLLEVLV